MQAEDGSWTTEKSPAGITADTAFATLFLLRSSKKSIEKAYGYGDSTLVAGRGLPKETANLHVAGGKVRAVPKWTTAAELLPILEKRDDRRLRARHSGPGPVAAGRGRNPGGEKHGPLAAAGCRPLAATRIAAVRAIGNGANLDLLPRLIYALGDPDQRRGAGCLRCLAAADAQLRPGASWRGIDGSPAERGGSLLERLVLGDPPGRRVRELT